MYTPDKQKRVTLVTVAPVAFSGTTLEELRTIDPQKYAEFSTEKDRFTQQLAVVYASITNEQRVNDAFQALQSAENARDMSPEAYQAARIAYYTLIRGEGWLNEERERIARVEVEPEVQRYQTALSNIETQKQQQQRTLDVVQGVKDRVISLKDDFQYSVTMLSDQVEKLKSQINIENRSREKPKDTFWQWLDIVLNIALIAVLAYAAWVLYKKFRPAPAAYTPPAPII